MSHVGPPVREQQQQGLLVGEQQPYQLQQQQQYSVVSDINTNINTNQPSSAMPSANQQSSAFSDAPPWVAQMLSSFDMRLQQIEKQLSSQNINWNNINLTLQSQNTRMSRLENQVKEINNVKQNIERCETSLVIMDRDVTLAKQKIDTYDQSIKTYSDICDDLRSDQTYTDTAINTLFKRVEHLEREQTKLKSSVTESASAITDLQCRSMRDNFVFTGIDEPDKPDGEYENTEKVLCEFLESEMNIDKPISFHRVHRMGNRTNNYDSPRPIVAKFEHFKDREEVRFTAPKTLKGKPYGVREQFPKVVEEKRKILYPEMKKARSDSRNKVRLVRDKLFINNIEFVPDETVNPQKHQNREQTRVKSDKPEYQQDKNSRLTGKSSRDTFQNKDGIRNIGYGKTRYIYPRPQSRNVNFSKQQFSRHKSDTFSLPTTNIFENLPVEDENPDQCGQNRPFETKKHKASSPLDIEKTFKKHRENENSDSESSDSDASHISYIEVDKSPQCNPPQTQGRTLSQPSIQTIDLSTSCNNTKLCSDSASPTDQQGERTIIKQKIKESKTNQISNSNSSVDSRMTVQSEQKNHSCDETVNHA